MSHSYKQSECVQVGVSLVCLKRSLVGVQDGTVQCACMTVCILLGSCYNVLCQHNRHQGFVDYIQ